MLLVFSVAMLIFTLVTESLFAQKKDSIAVGEIKGFVRDSVHNHIIQTATVAIYNNQNNSLLGYTLTNNFGEFIISGLPLNTSLRLITSYSGYFPSVRIFIIEKNAPLYDAGKVNINRHDQIQELKEVIISAPAPVRMKGDTLEFNADAFSLDKNAVVEDLMRKLPGITIWGDGKITINGKQVHQVLVDGKPFFGGNAKTALQNLPKYAVDKIQVYNSTNEKNSADSLVNLNIKLKIGYKKGAFGKLSLGEGTHTRYAADGMLNIFDDRNQLGIVGALNNTNKKARDINTLIDNNSFKGVGVSIDYQPDFTLGGIDHSQSFGLTFQHDFIPIPSYHKNNRLNGTYFLDNNNTDIFGNQITTSGLGNGNYLTQKNSNKSTDRQHLQHLDWVYNKENENVVLFFKPNMVIGSGQTNNEMQTVMQSNQTGILSSGQRVENIQFTNREVQFTMGLKTQNSIENRLLKGIDFAYTFGDSTYNNNRQVSSDLKVSGVKIAPPIIDRKYQSNESKTGNMIYLNYAGLKELLFKNAKLWGLNIGLSNKVFLNREKKEDNVTDRDTLSEKYVTNRYLTNKYTYTTVSYVPSIDISKNYSKVFTDRFKKVFDARISTQAELLNQNNLSKTSFQNFNRSYRDFIPKATVSYLNHQYGSFEENYIFSYDTKINIPGINQIAPLIDSSSVYFIQMGNPKIKREYQQEFSIHYNRRSDRPANNFLLDVSLHAGKTNEKMVDSIIYDDAGRETLYAINANGFRYINGSGLFQKAYKISKDHNLQFNLSSSVKLNRTPNYINNKFNVSRNLFIDNNINVYYNWKNALAFNVQQAYSYFELNQVNNANSFTNTTLSTLVSGSYNFMKLFNISSNITYRKNMNNVTAANNFTIWNAGFTARFLKGNNGEIKFSALDLLRQNKGLINYGKENSITTGVVNVLQYYYMITVSYYPRMFGKEGKDIR